MRRALGLALAALLALTACSGIPTSGSVNTGDIVDDQLDPVPDFLPSDPQPGSTPADLLSDFMQAATSPQDNFAVARKFLAESIRERWNPNAGVTIRTGQARIDDVTLDDARRKYVVTSAARIDEFGRYTQVSQGEEEELDFTFVQENGEWRISDLQPGIVLSSENFDAVYGAYPLYFFDPSFEYLVPDQRWFPTITSVTKRITDALLVGPSPWLTGAVVTAFPLGTVSENPVLVESGVAAVDLSTEARDADEAARHRMRQQLRASFANVPTVTSVDLVVSDVVLPIEEGAAAQAIVQPSVNPLPLVLQGDRFGFASSTSVGGSDALSATVVSLGAEGATVAGSTAAVRGPAGVSLVVGNDPAVLLDARTGVIDPTIDSFGYVWSGQGASVDSIRAYDSAGTFSEPVLPSVDPASRLVSMEVSRDGARLLLYLETEDSQPFLGVAAITRDGARPTRLGEFVALPVSQAAPVDAAWVDSMTVAALYGGAQSRVGIYPIGAPSFELGSLTDGRSIAAIGDGGTDDLRVLTGEGALLRPRGAGWLATDVLASFLGTQRPG